MLTIKNLRVEYPNGKKAVNGVSFELSPGENIALIGANGAGKTSLLLALVGILVSEGEISVGGTVLEKKTLREIRSRLGLVFQSPDDQLFMPTIYDDVSFGPRSYGYSEEETAARTNRILTDLGIMHLSGSSPLKLSGGEKRLCAIAAVLATEPEFLLFDEPTAFLDPRARRQLASTILSLPQGKIIATHDLDFAQKVCSRAIVLYEGKILANGDIGLLSDEQSLIGMGL
ncbi:MAG: energy-coupling factor ABC transporter ATP-binding protein [Eubacteriaceae bacterium]|nr:energy-coupling factor ABC transporter ATP-binding protein [Eubacteriaceae bacterium]